MPKPRPASPKRAAAKPAPARGNPASPPPIPRAEPNEAWTRRKHAASTYRPKRVRLLLVVDAPPADPSRYFYFEEAGSRDDLFEHVCEVMFEEAPRPVAKVPYLRELRMRGFQLVELKPDAPRAGEDLGPYAPWLALNVEQLAPERVALAGPDVDRAARRSLEQRGLPVLDAKVPSAATGADFRRELRRALVQAGLEKLIRPLPPRARAELAAEETKAPPQSPSETPGRRGKRSDAPR